MQGRRKSTRKTEPTVAVSAAADVLAASTRVVAHSPTQFCFFVCHAVCCVMQRPQALSKSAGPCVWIPRVCAPQHSKPSSAARSRVFSLPARGRAAAAERAACAGVPPRVAALLAPPFWLPMKKNDEAFADAEFACEPQSGAHDELDPKNEAIRWVELVTRTQCPEGVSLAEWLRTGVVLCKLINCISRGSVSRISESSMPFKQMGNIDNYVSSAPEPLRPVSQEPLLPRTAPQVQACKLYGVPEQDLFMTVDLFEEKNLPAVVRNIHSLGRVCQQVLLLDLSVPSPAPPATPPAHGACAMPHRGASPGQLWARASPRRTSGDSAINK